MALVKCKQCGNEVASNAAACPKCGAPVVRGSSTAKVLLIVFGGLGLCFFGTCLLGMVGSALKKGAQAGTGPAASARLVDIRTLLAEYDDNQVRADATFKGQYIQTSGLVSEVTKVFGSVHVTVGSGRPLEIPQVECILDSGQTQRAASLSRGSRVTVRGRVGGLMLNVRVHECEIL